MIAIDQIKQLTHKEKLMTMEAIWDDLSATADQIESPDWHADALKETEARAAAGLEEPIDWEVAKKQLRKEFE
jgi:hypothetical protein